MKNAKEEFLEESANKAVICALIEHEESYDNRKSYILSVGFNNDEMDLFINSLDFDYDSGFGGRRLYGTIWYKDGTWSDRREYDGLERWVYQKVPGIPKECAFISGKSSTTSSKSSPNIVGNNGH